MHRLSLFELLEDRRMLAIDYDDFSDKLESELVALQQFITDQVGLAQLPLVGRNLQQVPPFDGGVRENLAAAVAEAAGLTGADAEEAIETAIVDALAPLGVVAENVMATVDDDGGIVDISLDLSVELVNQGIDFSVGLAALPFYSSGGSGGVDATVAATYQNLDIHFAADAVDFGDFSDDVLSFTISAGLTSDLVELQVGFLKFTAEDEGSSLNVSFEVDLASGGTTSLDGNANIDLFLSTDIGENFPDISTNFVLEWDFVTDDSPDVAFEDVSVGLGQFVSRFLGPIVERIEPILDLVRPVTDILTEPIPGLDKLGLDFTLLDVADIVAQGAPPDVQGYIEVAQTIIRIADFATNLEVQGDETKINFGTYDVSGLNNDNLVNLPGAEDDPFEVQLSVLSTGGGLDFTALANALDDSPLPAGLKDQLSSLLTELQNGITLDVPFLNNPGGSIFKLLAGQPADLFTVQAQVVTNAQEDAFSDEFGLDQLPGITGGMEGEIDPYVFFRAGVDTFGLRQFLQSGQAIDVFDGFYFDTETEFRISGSVLAKVAFNAFAFHAGIEGGIRADLSAEIVGSGEDASLPDIDGDDDKVRFKEFDGCAFHAAGKVTFVIDAFLEVGVKIGLIDLTHREDFNIVEVEILNFDVGCLADPFAEEPELAELDEATGVVTLLIGPRAGDRSVAPNEINEVYRVRVIELPGAPPLQGQVIEIQAFGRTQVVEPGKNGTAAIRIVGDALDGNDSIQIVEGPNGQRFEGDVAIGGVAGGNKYFLSTANGFTSLSGGPGNDVLVGGHGGNLLVGMGGDDQITGGDNPGFENTLLGGAGADVLTGGTGNNVIHGGDGDDRITAGPGNDIIHAEAGEDVIHAGAGSSTIDGGTENDRIFWRIGNGAITVNGGLGEEDVIGFAGGDADDTFILAPDNGAVRVMGPGGPGPVISVVDGVEYFSVDGLGGADQILVNLLGGTDISEAPDVRRIAVNPSDNLNRDFLEDRIILWGSTHDDQIVVEQIEVDIQVIDETCDTLGENCIREYDQGGAMRVSQFPKEETGQFWYDVILMNYDDDLQVFAGWGHDDVDVLGITGPTAVDGGPGKDDFEVLPTGPLDFLAELVIDGGSGSNFLHADHRGVSAGESVVVADQAIQSNTLPGVNYRSSQLGNFKRGVMVTGTAMDDSIDVISTNRGDTTIVAGDDRSDAIFVGSDPAVPAQSDLADITGRLLIDGGPGVNDTLRVADRAATSGNSAVTLDLVNVPEVPGDMGVEITGLAGPLDDVSVVYKQDTFQQVRIETSDDSGVTETVHVFDSDSADLILEELSGDADFFIEASGGTVEIRGGLGHEAVHVVQQSENLDELGGTLTFLGGGDGPDRLEVFDKNSAPGTNYQLFEASLLRISGAGTAINYDGSLEELVLETSNVNDFVAVVQMPLAGSTNVDQGGGTNALIGPNIANVWIISQPNGGDLNNALTFQNSNVLTGSGQQDRFAFTESGTISIVDGGGGIDELDYSAFSIPIAVDVSAGTATNVAVAASQIENVTGGAGDDLIRGDGQANEISGGPGDDILLGLGGDDVLIGGLGRDLLFGGLGADTIFGGDDDDVLIHGQTAHDDNDAALMALLAEWTRTGPNSSYAERVSNLNNGGGLNGGMTLNSGTVFLEGSIDSLTGEGGLDWYWIRLGQDVIADLEPGEQTNGS